VFAGRRHLNFGANAKPPGEVLPVFLARDASLGGFRAVVSGYLNGFEREGCVPLGAEYDHGFGCPFPVRRFNIWTKDIGPIRLVGPGYQTAANPVSPALSQNAGFLQYARGYNGYGALAIPGKVYRLETNFTPGVLVDFSEWFLPQFFGAVEESIRVTTDLGECVVHARSSLHYGRFGPKGSASPGECRTALGGDLPVPTPAPSPCHTAVPEDECYRHVEWALQHYGTDPATYVGLAEDSSFEDFQAFLHQVGHGNCPRPCPSCHTAVSGEECYDHVRWAMQQGIWEHPEYYGSLTASSVFEDFQAFLHDLGHGACPAPCPSKGCHTTVVGEECYGHVMWVKEHGIWEHPGDYKELTFLSSIRDVQAFLFRAGGGRCPEPCPVIAERTATQRIPAQQTAAEPMTAVPTTAAPAAAAPTVETSAEEPAAAQWTAASAGVCHTAAAGEECFKRVVKEVAALLKRQPARYAGLLPGSLFEEVQAGLHGKHLGSCSRPCAHRNVGAPIAKRRFELFGRPEPLGARWPAALSWSSVAGLLAVLLLLPLSLVAVQRLRTRQGLLRMPLTAPRARTGRMGYGELKTTAQQ